MAAAVKPRAKPGPKSTPAQDKLNAAGIDAVCAMLRGGLSQVKIAKSIGVDSEKLHRWLAADPQRSARAREARADSARHWDDQAEKVLMDADETVPGSIAKARELASHYRWRAKCYLPREYGDKQEVEHSGSVDHSLEIKFVG